jgi:hypothetical protein
MKLRVSLSFFVPPTKWQMSGLCWGAEIKPKFIEQSLGLWRLFEGRKIVEDVL